MMYWTIPLFLSLAFTLINPFVGFFGLSVTVQLTVCFCLDINAKIPINMSLFPCDEIDKAYQEQLYKKGKGILNAWCVISVIMFLVIVSSFILVWAISSGRIDGREPVLTTPIDVFPNEQWDFYSLVLLVLGIAFNLVGTVIVFFRRRKLLDTPKPNRPPFAISEVNLDDYRFKTGIMPLVLLAAAFIFGLMDLRFGLISLSYMFYLLFIFVTKVVLASQRRAFDSKTPYLRYNAIYAIGSFSKTRMMYYAILWGVWFMISGVMLQVYLIDVDTSYAIFQFDAGNVFLALTSVFNTLTAIAFSIQIKKIGVKKEV